MAAVSVVNFRAPQVSFLWHNVIGASWWCVAVGLCIERAEPEVRSPRGPPRSAEPMTRPRVVIVGAGFGGLYAARALRERADVDVIVIDRTNHHVFQPLLYQVATATLAPTDIARPIRWLLRKQRNTDVVLAEVESIDPDDARRALRPTASDFEYDFPHRRRRARGTRTSGTPSGSRYAPGLKSVDDAIELRRRWLLAFERADRTRDRRRARAQSHVRHRRRRPDGRRARRHAADDRAVRAAAATFVTSTPRARAYCLLEGGPRLLPAFPDDLSARARRDLTELGVDVRTERTWSRTSATRGSKPEGERIEARTIFWAAGNAASPLGKSLGVDDAIAWGASW